MSGVLTFRWSVSAVLAILTTVALVVMYSGELLPDVFQGATILFFLPVLASLTILWSGVTLLKERNIQHYVELSVGAAGLFLFYYHVIRSGGI
jgi:hypothetical protein